MKRLKDILTQNGIRPTYQRIVIYKYLRDKRNHPDVDNIFLNIKDDVPTISRTTIYNTIHLFLEKGLVKEINITGAQTHYDIIDKPHHHFLCRDCGRIYDLPGECCFHSTGLIDGHRVEEMQGFFIGKCSHCLDKEKHGS